MTNAINPTDPEQLMAHTGRMRALAQRLIRDAAAADDVVQSALRLALEKGGAPVGREGPWLLTVVRNLATDRRRRAARAADREQEVARPEAVLGTAEAAANAERQRDVADAVLALDEPYRSVLLLRFFEELPPREIAKRLGRTSATVQQQVRRGLEQLRTKLESRYGDRGAWATALLPLAGRDAVKLGASAGGGAFGIAGLGWWRVAVELAALVGIVAGLGYLVRLPGRSPEPVEQQVVRSDTQGAELPSPVILAGSSGSDERGELATAVPVADLAPAISTAESEPATAVASGLFEARLVDLNGAAVAGVEVEWKGKRRGDALRALMGMRPARDSEPLSMRSDAGGWIRSEDVAGRPAAYESISWLRSATEGWKVFDGAVGPDGEIVVAMARSVRISGRTLEASGAPVANARVMISGRLDGVRSFGIELEDLQFRDTRQETRTNEFGEFDFGWAAVHPDFELNVVRDGETSMEGFPLPLASEAALELELRPARVKKRRIVHGLVRAAGGELMAGQWVWFGQSSAKTDASGRFEIDVSVWPQEDVLTARTASGCFAVVSGIDKESAWEEAGSGPYELVIPRRMKPVMVQIVDADGAPVRGVEVFVPEGTRYGSTMGNLEMFGLTENGASGVRTDRRGVAVLSRMLEQSYVLRILDPESLFAMDSRPIAPSDGLIRIVLPENRTAPRIEGRVVDFHGEPVAKATLRINVNTFTSRGSSRSRRTPSFYADDEGRFEILDAPWRHARLIATAPGGEDSDATHEFSEQPPTEPIELVIDRECETILELDGEADVDRALCYQADGGLAQVVWIDPGATMYARKIPRMDDGTFPIAHIPQSVTEIALCDGEAEVRRVSVRLEAGKRSRISL